MTTGWDWPGSRWWRVDLHTHSPASHDFKPEPDRQAKDWTAWVAAAKASGVHAIALTDHNTPEGLGPIQAAAATEDLVVFPGVEASVGGVHLLLILDAKCTRDHVVALLAHLGVSPNSYGEQDATCSKSIIEVLEIATSQGAVAIGAHVNGPKGLLTMPPGLDRLNALKAPDLLGVEVSPLPPNSAEYLDPASPDTQRWLDGSQTDGRKLPQLSCSDSHTLTGLGRRFTWVKMTRPSIEGLRLALIDGEGSLCPGDASSADDPNVHASNAIESITISQAKHIGRSNNSATGPLTLSLNPWLNAIIGGRGTGKSTVVDLCRLALRREKELGPDGSELASAFQSRMRVPPIRDAEGLLTAETTVQLVYRKDGERFRISWDKAGRAHPIERLDGDTVAQEAGDIRDRFPARIYSQKQLFDLAKQPNALLTVIDDSPKVRGADAFRRLAETEANYLSLCAAARAKRAQAAELPAREAAAADVRRKLEVLQQGGHTAILSEYRTRQRRDGTWLSILDSATGSIAAVGNAAGDRLTVADLDLGTTPPNDAATAGLVAAHDALRSIVAQLRETVGNAVERALADIERLKGADDIAAWNASVSAADAAYQTVTRRLSDAGISNADEYRNLLQRAAALEQEIAALGGASTEAAKLEQDAAAALAGYRAQRAELTEKRREFAASASGEVVKIEIGGAERRDIIGDALRDALAIPHFEPDYQNLLEAIAPGDESPWTFTGLDDTVRWLRATAADPAVHWPTKDKRFEAKLRALPPERLDRVALLHPDDVVRVSFRAASNRGWQRIEQGSPGQQTAALLAFVLGYGDEPIILDQPEDDLDNTLIYELLVERLREIKKHRQIIVVTHNPNIVVHGDADLVISLVATNQTHVKCAGGLQEQQVRDEVCRVMEGGRDAFRTRYRRLMLPGGSRDGST
jgi:hypothetical protein